jgi:hypothetical protein
MGMNCITSQKYAIVEGNLGAQPLANLRLLAVHHTA